MSLAMHRSRRLCRICRVDCFDDAVTRACCQRADEQSLQGAVYGRPLRVDGDPVLDVAEYEQDDDGDANGDEESVGDILHGEVGYHGDQAAYGRKRVSSCNIIHVFGSEL